MTPWTTEGAPPSTQPSSGFCHRGPGKVRKVRPGEESQAPRPPHGAWGGGRGPFRNCQVPSSSPPHSGEGRARLQGPRPRGVGRGRHGSTTEQPLPSGSEEQSLVQKTSPCPGAPDPGTPSSCPTLTRAPRCAPILTGVSPPRSGQ